MADAASSSRAAAEQNASTDSAASTAADGSAAHTQSAPNRSSAPNTPDATAPKSKTVRWTNVGRFAGASIAYLIGSGFATGQETLQFFASHGIVGLIGGVISTLLFMTLGALIMRKGSELQLELSSEVFQYYVGRFLGTVLEWFAVLYSFSVAVIMVSGAGAVLNELTGLPNWVGVVGMALLGFATVLAGLERLVDIIGTIGPVIILFTVVVGVIIFVRDFGDLGSQPIYDSLLPAAESVQINPSFIWSAVLYVSFNVLLGMVFFSQLGKEASSPREATLAGTVGGLGLGIGVLMITLAILTNITLVIDKEVPTLALGQSIHPAVGFAFAVVVMLGIYSTATPLYWIVKNQVMGFVPKSWSVAVTTAVCIILIVCGFLPFSTLVDKIYGTVGYVGFALIVVIIGRMIYDAVKRRRAS